MEVSIIEYFSTVGIFYTNIYKETSSFSASNVRGDGNVADWKFPGMKSNMLSHCNCHVWSLCIKGIVSFPCGLGIPGHMSLGLVPLFKTVALLCRLMLVFRGSSPSLIPRLPAFAMYGPFV